MDQESQVDSFVEAQVDRLVEQLDISHPDDLDLRRVAQHLRIRVFDADFSTVALCERRIIFLRRGLEPCEEREQLAHEIAHVELHCGGQVLAEPAFVALQEQQAEAYARKLLMPRRLLRRVTPSITASNIMQHLAWLFRVRLELVERRLLELGSFVHAIKAIGAVVIALDVLLDILTSLLA